MGAGLDQRTGSQGARPPRIICMSYPPVLLGNRMREPLKEHWGCGRADVGILCFWHFWHRDTQKHSQKRLHEASEPSEGRDAGETAGGQMDTAGEHYMEWNKILQHDLRGRLVCSCALPTAATPKGGRAEAEGDLEEDSMRRLHLITFKPSGFSGSASQFSAQALKWVCSVIPNFCVLSAMTGVVYRVFPCIVSCSSRYKAAGWVDGIFPGIWDMLESSICLMTCQVRGIHDCTYNRKQFGSLLKAASVHNSKDTFTHTIIKAGHNK